MPRRRRHPHPALERSWIDDRIGARQPLRCEQTIEPQACKGVHGLFGAMSIAIWIAAIREACPEAWIVERPIDRGADCMAVVTSVDHIACTRTPMLPSTDVDHWEPERRRFDDSTRRVADQN